MEVKSTPFDQVSLYIGSKEGYSGQKFSEDDLIQELGVFQANVSQDELCSLRVTPTKFVVKDYIEDGWEVTAINYPRFPKSSEVIYRFMRNLGEHLLKRFKQNRISIVLPKADRIWMLESEEAEETHRPQCCSESNGTES